VPSPTPAESAETPPFTVYSTTWCGYCTRLKRQLRSEGISFAEVDIEQDPGAEALVKAANGGNATVPTLVFADGSALTNPSVRDVVKKLAAAA
jgi:mycoredoxin